MIKLPTFTFNDSTKLFSRDKKKQSHRGQSSVSHLHHQREEHLNRGRCVLLSAVVMELNTQLRCSALVWSMPEYESTQYMDPPKKGPNSSPTQKKRICIETGKKVSTSAQVEVHP